MYRYTNNDNPSTYVIISCFLLCWLEPAEQC